MIFVLAGDAVHGINGSETALRASDLVLLRPGDRHFIRFKTGVFLHYINIAVGRRPLARLPCSDRHRKPIPTPR